METESAAVRKAGATADQTRDDRVAHSPEGHSRKEFFYNLLLTLPFLLLYWVNLAHHTLWFDEINPWGISAASPDLRTLFSYVHYEGHPWLWYFLLWIPSRFTYDPRAMLWIVAPIGTAIYLLIGLASPFTRLQKAIIFLGYFVAFEYTVMNRMYDPMFLLALLYVWRRMRKPDGMIGNVLLLAVMANTDMTGVLLSGALLLEYAFDRWQAHTVRMWSSTEKRAAVTAFVIYVALLGFSVASLVPSPYISWQSSGKLGAQVLHVKHLVRSIVNLTAAPWWPISVEYPRRFWLTDLQENHKLLYLTPVVLLAYWQIFKREKGLLLLLGLTLLFGVLFADVVYPGHVRNWGIVYVSFLVCLWISNAKRAGSRETGAASWSAWTYGLIGMSALAGVLALGSSWVRPFSDARATAEWIQKNEPPDVALVGLPDLSFAGVAEELQRPVYFVECRCVARFKLFSKEREQYPEEQLPAKLVVAQQDLKTNQLLLISYRPLLPADLKGLANVSLSAQEVAKFDSGDVGSDIHYIYRITKSG